jgi:DNA-nicking Smr family endonuclease
VSDDSTKNADESLFRSEMTDVTPLKPHNKVSLDKKPKKPVAQRQKNHNRDRNIEDVFSDSAPLQECPDILAYSRGGLQNNALKKLRLGQYPVETVLDLHGMTVEQARKKLLAFLAECGTSEVRHVLIIHGKGYRSADKAVIKPMVNRWLQATDTVLAFHTAQPRDGGSGAVYVLLKKTV